MYHIRKKKAVKLYPSVNLFFLLKEQATVVPRRETLFFLFLVILYRVFQEERSIFWDVIVSVILSKNISMNIRPIQNEKELFEKKKKKIVDKKEILRVRTVSNTGIYCSSDRVGTVYNVRKIPPSAAMHFCNSCGDMAL
jgi:hypothetical protein